MLGTNIALAAEAVMSNFRRPAFPYKLTFAVTYNCNSRCKTCNIWQNRSTGELTLGEIDSFLRKNGGFRWVAITGGEPFLRRDLPEICESFAKNCPLQILTITTNSLLPTLQIEGIRKIAKLKIPRLIVTLSCDGAGKLHDEIRGVPGNFEKLCRIYSELRGLQDSHFRIFFGMTLSSFNVGKFDELYRELHSRFPEIGYDRIHVNVFHTSSHFYSNAEGGAEEKREKWKRAAIAEMRNVLLKRRFSPFDSLGFLERRYIKGSIRYMKTGRSPMSCLSLSSSMFLDPHGNLYPCTIWNRKMASIRENKDLRKLWNSREFRETARLARELKCPNCWTPCEAYQTILGNLL